MAKGFSAAALLTFFLAASVGCGPTIMERPIDPASHSARPENYPITLHTDDGPDCPRTTIAELWASQGPWWQSWLVLESQLAGGLRERARALGGDALIRLRFKEEATGVSSERGEAVLESGPFLAGTVVRWTASDCP